MSSESKFVVNNSNRIVAALESGDKTCTELSKQLNINYHSTLKALHYLIDQGLVTSRPGHYRNIKFSIAPDNAPNSVIPTIKTPNGSLKIWEFLHLYSTKAPKGAVAVVNIPKHVTRIFRQAEVAAEGKNVEIGIDLLRKDMERDYEALKQATDYYKQLLDHPRIWDPQYLARFPSDTTFNEGIYKEAFAHYFKEEEDS